MIPLIGIMIGGYIILRCFDVLSRQKSSFSSEEWRNWMLFMAVIVMIATIIESLGLMFSGSSMPRG